LAPLDVQAYLAEARIVAGLDHPAIVPVYDVGRTEDGCCYVVSKLIQGKDLAARMKESRLSQEQAAGIVIAIAEALHHAHTRGLVHRDIKPANILLDEQGRPHVVDFGLALKNEDLLKDCGGAGTPAYTSPEQAGGEAHRVDARSDIFSLGVVLYELITGQRPFRSDSHDGLLEQILWAEARPPRQWDASISEELERICVRALSKRASDRYATAMDLAEDLRHFLEKTLRRDAAPAPAAEHVSAASVAPAGTGRRSASVAPSLPQQMAKAQKWTPVGRAQLRLAERSMMWSVRPERRQLPSWCEWIAIRALTRRASWTGAQQTMMRVAARRHALTASCVVLLMLAFLLAGAEVAAPAKNLLTELRAGIAVLQLTLGRQEAVWPLMKHASDPTLRTSIIHRLTPLAIGPQQLAARLRREEDVAIRRAMLLGVGELVGDPKRRTTRSAELRRADPLAPELLETYRNDPDPGIHAAAEWTLRRYEQEDPIARIDHQFKSSAAAPGDRQWRLTSEGHTMVVIPGPQQFLMGAPDAADSPEADERLHSRRILRSFSIASKETTVEQFQRFLANNPQVKHPRPARSDPPPNLPQTSVTWYEAAAYCNWLSMKEDIPQDQWCYRTNAEGHYAAGMKPATDSLSLRGYRLPTEAEWEYSCRAGAATAWCFGNDNSRLDQYAVFQAVSPNEPLAVGTRKPSDFGLYDMHGNAAEWCQDLYLPYPRGDSSRPPDGSQGGREVRDADRRVLRGGSFRDPASRIRCAARGNDRPSHRDPAVGFRIARSFP
jgi:formylglycine-generating enzyme required for sulfatase activity